MLDGIYQSLICFYMAYLVFYRATFESFDGKSINDGKRIGIYVGTPAVMAVNIYILLNTYRWDWLMVLITTISVLLIWFWTGVYTAFTAGETFYRAAPQVYSQLTFWATIFLTIIIALLPRFAIKSFQKMFMPLDVDIVREQMRQGKFDYLKDADVLAPPPPDKLDDSTTSSDISKPVNGPYSPDDDRRPMYPPSTAPTATTHNPRSNNGSDGTNYTADSFVRPLPNQRTSWGGDMTRMSTHDEQGSGRNSFAAGGPRASIDRPRPSFDRIRQSMDRTRPSFEQSRDFTSAALLTRMESSYSGVSSQGQGTAAGSRTRDHTPDPMGQRGRNYVQPGQAI
jgi:phospholipid-translocating ATPase